ncbi:MAG: formylglycine-generating enzyme family protein [bacterium]|nr:formylglycine-generating enzyme family protein [bacterium]
MNHRSPRSVLQLAIAMLLTLTCCASSVEGEHRAALLISVAGENDQTTSKAVKTVGAAFEQLGVRCEKQQNPDNEKALRNLTEDFANRTPTAGTAIVYFHGPTVEVKQSGKVDLMLIAADEKNDRGYRLSHLLAALSERGGSQLNIVLLDSSTSIPADFLPPPHCLLAQVDSKSLIDGLSESKDWSSAIQKAASSVVSSMEEGVQLDRQADAVVSPPESFSLGEKPGDEWVDASGAVFAWCPAGRFVKGSPPHEAGRFADETQQEIVIEHGFWISKYEMTLSENLRNHPRKTIAADKNHPLTMVNHDDIMRMTTKTMTEKAQERSALPKGWRYCLPTADQWEYAARAGSKTAYSFGDDLAALPKHANFADRTYFETGDIFSQRSHRVLDDGVAYLARVGSYRPNPWGLHDVHGNVAEWCVGGAIRGGSWTSTPEYCRSAMSQVFSSRNEQNFIGYRIVIARIPDESNTKNGEN